MMSEVSNRFDSYLTSKVNASSPSGTVIIPPGCYFIGQISYRNQASGTYSVVALRDSSGADVAVLSADSIFGDGRICCSNASVTLNEGTYSWQTLNANANDTYMAITGVCFRK